jgi:hypothetical protein
MWWTRGRTLSSLRSEAGYTQCIRNLGSRLSIPFYKGVLRVNSTAWMLSDKTSPILRGTCEGIIMIQAFVELISISDNKNGNYRPNTRPQA